MASQLINIIVNSKGFVTVQKQLNELGNSAKTTTTYLNSMRAILAAAMTFSGAGAIVQVVDNFTQLQNRLKLVTNGTQELTSTWNQLMGVANSSYSTIDSTVTLYQRVAQAYKAWGENASKAMEFTDLFQKAALLSGSTMQTTSQAVYQFSQALNKGKLDGDEFRSVLEGLPYVANIIQKSLGVTRAELYELSASGKISLDRLKSAFEDAADAIRGDFSKITPTIGMALVVLQNKWTEFIGDIQTSTGVFTLVAKAILLIANHFYILAAAMTPVAVGLSYMAGKLVIGLLVTAFTDMRAAIIRLIPVIVAFSAALWTNPILLIAGVIAAIVAAIVYFRNELGLTNEVLMTVWNVWSTVFMMMLQYGNPIGLMITLIVQALGGWNVVLTAIGNTATAIFTGMVTAMQIVGAAISDLASFIGSQLASAFQSLMAVFQEWYGLIGDIAGLFMDSLNPAIEALQPAFSTFWEYAEPALKMFVQFAKDVYAGWQKIGDYIGNNLMNIIKTGFSFWIDVLKEILGIIQRVIQALRTVISLMRTAAAGLGGGGGGGGAGANYGLQGYAGEFNTGGGFKVGGTGAGRDTTPVSFRANRGERVTVETKKQQRQNDNAPTAANVNVPVTITNVFDPSAVVSAIDSSKGQKAIVNVIAANRDQILSVLGVA